MIAWIASALGRIAAPWARLLADLFIVLLIIGGIFLSGFHTGHSSAADACMASKADDAAARIASLTTLLKLGPDPTNQSGVLADQQQQARVVYQTIRERIPYAVNRYISVPSHAPGYVYCPVSRGVVGVWNDALAGRSSVPVAAGQSVDPTDGADPAQAEDSGLALGDLVTNHVDNAEQCAGIRDQLNALITWLENQRKSNQ